MTLLNLNPAEPIEVGDVLFTVDLRPVVAAAGAVPAFRDLYVGVRGPDVRQLRSFLGLSDEDYFDWVTKEAVLRWQEGLGMVPDGVVMRGDVLFLDSLPTRGFAVDGVSVGSQVTAGQPVISTVRERPEIAVPADASGSQFAQGMTARVLLEDTVVDGTLAGPFSGQDGLPVFFVVDSDGLSVCDASCANGLPVTGTPQVTVEVDIVPRAEGVVVPDSAIVVLPDGAVAVREPGGEFVTVEVVTRGQGLSIVEGLEPGTVIELFGEEGGP